MADAEKLTDVALPVSVMSCEDGMNVNWSFGRGNAASKVERPTAT